MSIIYSYPIKGTPANDDLILISDSASSPQFATKQIKVSSLPGGSASGVSSFNTLTGAITITGGTNVTLNPVGNNIEINAAGGGGTPDGPDHSIQYKNGSAFAGSNDLTFHPTNNIFSVKHTVIVKGQGNGNPAGRLKLNCEQDSHAITLEGPAHSGGADYTLKFPSPAPSNQQILQSDGSGVLSWINTPSSGGGGAVDSVNTTDGTYINLTPNSATTGAVTVSADLSAVDGTSDTTTKFLSKNNTWDVPSYTTNTDTTYSAGTGLSLNTNTFSLATNAALTNLGGGTGSTFLQKDGTWATTTDTNTNIANSNLQLDSNRQLDFGNGESISYSLDIINTQTAGVKNLFKFDQIGGTSPRFTVGHTESAYEGYITLEGNGSNRTGILKFENAAGTYYTSIQAPNTFGANNNIGYVLPNLQGAANSVLTNNGSGTLSWGTGTEEASWTPTSANSNTISNAYGKYTKIGNTVFASFAFTMSGSTSISLSGLPFSGVYAGANKGTSIISVNNCASVQGQIIGGQMAAATSFTFNAYTGSGSGLPTKLQTTTSSMYQTAGGTYSGIIIYQTS